MLYILYRYTIRTKIINHKNHNHQSYNHDDVTIIFPIRHAICSARGLPDDRNERAPGPGAYDVHEKLGASAGCNDLVSTCFDWKSGPYGLPGIHGFIIGLSSFYLWTWPFWGETRSFEMWEDHMEGIEKMQRISPLCHCNIVKIYRIIFCVDDKVLIT